MEPSIDNLLTRMRAGHRDALDQLMPLVYGELRKVAAGYLSDERRQNTLQPTALVHEAYLRMIGANHPEYQNRSHFLGIAAAIMRQILVDHARSRQAAKRGGPAITLSLNEGVDGESIVESPVEALDDALRSLARIDERKACLVELRFFGGMTALEIADYLPDSVHRVRHEMRLALAWLHREVAQTK